MKRPIGIGLALRTYRQRMGLTQKKLAEILADRFDWPRISRPIIAQWESGDQIPGDVKMMALEELLGVDPGTFILAKYAQSLKRMGIKMPQIQRTEEENMILSIWRTEGPLGLLRFAATRAQEDQSRSTAKKKGKRAKPPEGPHPPDVSPN